MERWVRACLQMDPESRPVMTAVVQVLAMLIPNNARKSASLPIYGVQIPFSMSWNPDFCNYNFSREEDLNLDESVMPSKQIHTGNVMSGSTFEPEIQKMCCSPKWTGRHTILLGLGDILASQEEPKLDIPNGTSSGSASDYLKSFSSSTTDNPAHADILRGRDTDICVDKSQTRRRTSGLPNIVKCLQGQEGGLSCRPLTSSPKGYCGRRQRKWRSLFEGWDSLGKQFERPAV